MILFQTCQHCGTIIKDKKILQLLEVFPVKCPNCGERITPIKTDVNDIYVTITEVNEDCTIETAPIEMISDGMPEGFVDTLNIGGKQDDRKI